MLPGCCKNGIVISKIPVMQAGLKEVGDAANLLI
ncbi:LuxR family transcriptional regulator [Shigella sonnei]|uniref:LuxR family transcriptional regulator n=1 Tax=Shigella sonnei TaxID=624 RepID=A0A8B4CEE3_SHISO|nr:LuxR family transcriptional regulator [Shigella sonnei]CSE38840.1 LuxR family transcriptional regulator [Shigella sonnei]CSE41853.1 LuxR family transcriptional regulator [Shigella sonnei]CSE43451.1 LuxR family transcriptional regulator [Shigella sonnei]CSE44837.1 LuxR family transcriptional regulator [Shigella sonnei]